jgi:hypothetical protein
MAAVDEAGESISAGHVIWLGLLLGLLHTVFLWFGVVLIVLLKTISMNPRVANQDPMQAAPGLDLALLFAILILFAIGPYAVRVARAHNPAEAVGAGALAGVAAGMAQLTFVGSVGIVFGAGLIPMLPYTAIVDAPGGRVAAMEALKSSALMIIEITPLLAITNVGATAFVCGFFGLVSYPIWRRAWRRAAHSAPTGVA